MSFPLYSLPNELLTLIFDHLNPLHRSHVRRVCRRFSGLIDAKPNIPDCFELWLDFDKQFLFMTSNKSWSVIYMNGALPHNSSKKTEGGSWFLDCGADTSPSIVRDLGNKWNERIRCYLHKIKFMFKNIRDVRIRFAEEPHTVVPKELLGLWNICIEDIILCRRWRIPEILLPNELLPLVSSCVGTLRLDYMFDPEPDTVIPAKKFRCRISEESVLKIIIMYLMGIFPKVNVNWKLEVIGNVDKVRTKVIDIFGSENLREEEYLTYLPPVQQLSGEVYSLGMANNVHSWCDIFMERIQ